MNVVQADIDRIVAGAINLSLEEALHQVAGIQERQYLGMSSIGYCPRRIYNDLVLGRDLNDRAFRYCRRGYVMEAEVKNWLAIKGYYARGSEKEVVAPFDERFRGHTDGEAEIGLETLLLEIKSVQPKEIEEIRATGKIKPEKMAQVQCYMRYGPWDKAMFVFVQADSFDHETLFVRKADDLGARYERKAKGLLKAWDAQDPPDCLCGYCRK